MAMNPMEMLKIAERMKVFNAQHPRVQPFINDIVANGIQEGSVIEMKVTSPEGREFITNIKVTAEDLETVAMLRNIRQ